MVPHQNAQLKKLAARRGTPVFVRFVHGPELIAHAVADWLSSTTSVSSAMMERYSCEDVSRSNPTGPKARTSVLRFADAFTGYHVQKEPAHPRPIWLLM